MNKTFTASNYVMEEVGSLVKETRRRMTAEAGPYCTDLSVKDRGALMMEWL